ncbi:MAG: hypothetical protein NT138_03985, partial [Planctomycetales bacterium]|nr:hypothetical protein [Planctomycetales bacterium]
MVLEFPFNRRTRRRSTKSEQVADVLLNAVRQSSATPSPRRRARAGQLAVTAHRIQMLEERLLLAANINLATWAGTPFLLEASGSANNATITLKNRSDNTVLTTQAVNNATGSLTITGSNGADDVWINLSGVYAENGSGTITTEIPVSFAFTGGTGNDSVKFTGNTAVSNTLSVIAETITVDASVRVDAPNSVSLTATANAGTVNETGLLAASTWTNSAAVTVSGKVTSSAVTLSAATSGTISTISSGSLGSATNTWTDAAVVTVNAGAIVKGTSSVTILADRATTYLAQGRSAKNEITGDTKVIIGGSGTAAQITSGGDLSIKADNRITTTAKSPQQVIDPGALGFPANIAVSAAQNLITGDTKVSITNSTVTQTGSGATTVEANRRLVATAEAETDSLTYAAIPGGQTVSLNGTYAANQLSGSVTVIVMGGSFTTGAATVAANDDATASVKSGLTARTTSFGTAFNTSSLSFGASIAFNLIGGSGLSAALRTVDTLLGTSVTPATASQTLAMFDNTIIDVTGSLAVTSDSGARANATVSNAVESNVSGVSGATGSAASGIVASNLINSSSMALVKPFDHNSSAGTVSLAVGQKVKVATGHSSGGTIGAIYEFIGTAGSVNLSTQNYSNASSWKLATAATTAVSGALNITANDTTAAFSNAKLVSSSTVTNDGGMRLLQNGINSLLDYDYSSSATSVILAFGDKVRVLQGSNAGGIVGSVYEYLGVAGTTNLTTQNYANLDLWKPVDATEYIPQGINLTDSSSVAVGGIVVRNDIKSSATATLLNATLTDAGSVAVRAVEDATIKAEADATVQSSGGSAFGSGMSLAVNGVIATNTVLSNASALIQNSSITTNSTSPNTGNVSAVALNTSEIDAINKSIVTAGQNAVGVTLAFNTIGYEPQNTLFSSIDAILGTDIGTQTPARTSAQIINSPINAAGDLAVTATSTARINSTLSNEATSAASALINASGMAVGMVVSSNMVSTDVDAAIKSTASAISISADSVNVAATDDNTIEAETTLLSSSTTTNDGGASLLNKLGTQLQQDYAYSSLSGTKSVKFGDKVRVASTYSTAAARGLIYQYMGTDTSVNLGTTDYTNYGLWKKLDAVNVLPVGLNISDSDSMGIGGLVVRNDIIADVDSVIEKATVNAAGNIVVTANGTQQLTASADATANSSGGSAVGTGTSLAVGGSIVTNTVQGGAEAHVLTSSLTTTNSGNVSVTAVNSGTIDATNATAITSGSQAIGVTMAFNTVGHESQNVLFNTLDALIKTNLGTAPGANATAFIRDTPVDSAGDVTVTATAGSLITSEISNETASAASALMNASSMAVGTVLSSNMVKSAASAKIEFTTLSNGAVTAAGDLTVDAQDAAGISATSNLDVTAETTNDGGISTLQNYVAQALPNDYNYTSLSGTRNLGGPDFQHETTSGTRTIGRGTRIMKRGTSGAKDQVYQFVGVAAGSTSSVNLGTEDYTNAARWQPIYRRTSQKVRVAPGHAAGGVAGGVYRYLGAAGNVNLTNEDYGNTARWQRIDQDATLADFIPSFGNITASDATGVGVHVVRNDVVSSVVANINKVNLTVSGDIAVNAIEKADLQAAIESTVTVAGGSEFADSTVLGVNATVASNLVLSSAIATINDSDITTPSSTTGADVTVFAENRSGIEATINSSTESGGPGSVAAGVTLAFNTLGYQSQNVLFDTIDALLGTSIGTAQPARVEAAIVDTTVGVSGDVSVTADNEASLNAAFGSEATGDAAASILIASNLVQTDADAAIRFTSTVGAVTAGGDITIDAKDKAAIISGVTAVTGGDAGPSYYRETLTNALRPLNSPSFNFISSDGTQNLSFGNVVKVAKDHEAGGDPGYFYKYMGKTGAVDLSEADFTDKGYWQLQVPFSVPAALDVGDNEGLGVGALVVRNDVRSDVDSKLSKATVNAGGNVTVQAIEDSSVHALIDSEVTANGGSAFGEDTSLAVNAVIATNLVLSTTDALIEDSSVTTTANGGGDVIVNAENTALINARTLASTSAGNTSGTGTLAFNTVGWAAQNLLFNTVDTLLGKNAIGSEQPVKASAIIEDSTINADGEVSVTATSEATVKALLSNESTSKSAAIRGGSALAVGVAISSNLVSSDAEAYVRSTTATPISVTSGGTMTVHASDTAKIDAKSKLAAIASTSQDLGIGLLMQGLVDNHGIDFTDRSGTRTVANGSYVYVDDADYSSNEVPDEVTKGQRVRLEFDTNGFKAGDVLEYISSTDLTDGVDLDEQTYSDAAKWRKIKGAAAEIYKYVGTSGSINLETEDYTVTSKWTKISTASPTDLVPGLQLNPSSSSATAFGMLVVRNDARSDVDAYMEKVTASAGGDLTIRADESATIKAIDISMVSAKGGSITGQGNSIAVGGVVATNLVKSAADAYAKTSSLTTTGSGDVIIDANNESKIDALIKSTIESNGVGVGVTLAFNTVGWNAQNFLFNTVDIIIGNTPDTRSASTTKAWTLNTTIDSADKITITADSDARIDARIANSSTSISATPAGASTTVAVGAVLALNKVATDVDATVTTASTFNAGDDVTVSAKDESQIKADVASSSLAVSLSGSGKSLSVPVSLAMCRNEIDQTVDALISNATGAITGDVVVSTQKSGEIISRVSATSIGVAAGTGTSIGVSGGGSLAFNTILGTNNAQITGGSLTTTAGGGNLGTVSITADDTSKIDAVVKTLSVAVAIGAGSAPGVALGMSVAKNLIGFSNSSPTSTYNSDADPATLVAGNKVKVVSGPLTGRVFEYFGATLSGSANIKLNSQNYHDRSAWRPVDVVANAAQIHAGTSGANIAAAGALNVEAESDAFIDATVLTGSVGIGAAGSTGVGVAVAGVYTENTIRTDVEGRIVGGTIIAKSVTVSSDDAASIKAVAGAAAVSVSLAGSTAVSVSIGLSLAFNEISSETDAYISGSANVSTTNSGAVNVTAISRGTPLFDFVFNSGETSAADRLDDASIADPDEHGTGANEQTDDATADALIFTALNSAFTSNSLTLATTENVRSDWNYTTNDGTRTIKPGEKVRPETGYRNGGVGGRVYEYLGSEGSLNLTTQNYGNTALWKLVPSSLKLSILDKGKAWLLVDGNGDSYTLTLNSTDSTKIDVSRSNISAIAAAAAAGVAIGGSTGVAVSGAGAVALNSILTKTRARLDSAVINSTGAVNVNSVNSAVINSTVVAASASVGVGGSAGIGASIGIAVAKNLIGYEADGDAGQALVESSSTNTSISAAGNLVLQSVSSQKIGTVVFAGSVALAGGGSAGVAFAGSGVYVENRIDMDSLAFISGDGTGISAVNISVLASDVSLISAFAGAASISAALGGTAGVSLSAGAAIARNDIGNEVHAYIINADSGVTTTTGDLTIRAVESASIQAMTAAAALAVGLGGVAGIAVSGAGADAANLIHTSTKAYAQNSILTAGDDVVVEANNTAGIRSLVFAVSVGVGIGGKAGVGASVGVSLARNFIGWTVGTASATHASGQTVANLNTNQTVKIDSGVRQGEVYRYVGTNKTSVNLRLEDYGNTKLWQRTDLTAANSEVVARLQDTTATIADSLTVKSTSSSAVRAEVMAGSFAAGGGLVGVALSGAGVSSENRIANDVIAEIVDDRNVSVVAGVILVQANDTSVIDAKTGAASIAAGFGVVGAAISIGVAIAHNQIENEVRASIRDVGTKVQTTVGAISLQATDSSTIRSETAAASLAIGGGAIGVAISGAGARATNVILSNTIADVTNAKLESKTNVNLTASSSATVNSKVAAVAASMAVGAAGAGVAIGASVAENYIGFNANGTAALSAIRAYVTGSEILAYGALNQTATSTANISSIVIAGAVAAAVGPVGVAAGAGAGVDTTNRIGQTIQSYIVNSIGNGISSRGGTLSATDNSTINATAGAAAVAAALGIGGAAAISVALANNSITNTVESYVQNSTVKTESTWLSSQGSQSILSGQRVRLADSFTGSGTPGTVYEFLGNAINHSSAHDRDYVSTNAPVVVTSGQRVLVASGHTSGGTVGDVYEYLGRNHQFTSASGSEQITAGDRVLLAAGYNAAKGVAGRVYEYIGSGNPNINLSNEDYLDTGNWKDVSLLTLSTENFAGSFWKNVSGSALNDGETVLVSSGHTAGGTAGTLYRYLGRPIQFATTNGTQTVAPGHRVSIATDYDALKAVPGSIYQYIGTSASLNLGTQNYLDVAKWKEVALTDLSEENYSNTAVWQNISLQNLGTQNYTDTTRWRAVSEGLTLSATETASISAISAAAALSAGMGAVSGGGAQSTNSVATLTATRVMDSNLRLSGDLSLQTTVNPTATTTVGSVSLAAGISIAAGGSVAEVTFTPTVAASITNSNVIAEDIDVRSTVTPKATAEGYGVNAGSLAVGASKATINIVPTVSATVGGIVKAASLDVEALTLKPNSGNTATAETTGASGGLIGIDATRTLVSHGGSVTSSIAASSNMSVSGTTNVIATSVASHSAKADSFAAGLLAVGVSYASAVSTTNVTATVGSSTQFSGGSLMIAATRDHNQYSDNLAGGGGVAAGASATAYTAQTGTVLGSVAASGNINLTNTFDMGAVSTTTLNGRVRTFSGGLLAGAGAEIDNIVDSTVTAQVGNNVQIAARDIAIDAGNVFRKPDLGTDNIRGTTGGLISGANASSETIIAFDTKVSIGNNATLTGRGTEASPGEFALRAVNDIRAVDKVSFVTGGALSGAGSYSTVKTSTATGKGDFAAVVLGTSATLTNPGDIVISARGTGDVSTKANAETYGVATVAIAETESILRPVNTVTIGANSTITSLGNVLISAGTDTNFNRDQYTVKARTDSFAGSAIPLDKVDSDATLLQTNQINVAAGAIVQSAQDLKVHAERFGFGVMDSKAKAVNWASAAAGAINSALGGSEQFDGTVTVGATGVVDVQGTLRTGIRRNRTLVLGEQSGGQWSGWNTATGVIGTISNDSNLEFTQGLQLLESGLFDQLRAARTNMERYRTTNTTLLAFYEAEIYRIEQELLSKGLAEVVPTSGGNTTIVPVELYVLTVTLRPTRAQAGIIDVRGDALVGTGVLNAPRDANLTVTNHTPARLIIEGITIPEQTGGVFMNGINVLNNTAIAQINIAGQGSASFATITPSTTSTGSGPAITLTNTFDGSSYTGTVTYPTPDILVSGDITNYSGSVTSISEGSIIYRASIRAGNITTIAGGSVFIDGVSTYSVGGDPYGKLKSLGDGISQYNTTNAINLLTNAPVVANLLGDTVIINAEYININGLIQSGKETYSLTLPSTLSTEITNIRNGSSASRLTLLSVSNKDFKVFYDRVENKIVVREVRVSGGNVQLTGNILSTGAGTIRVLDGFGNISIDNQTAVDLEVERIDASQRGAGTLLLADKAKAPGSPTFTTASGTQSVSQGNTVSLASTYTGGGITGAVYQYVGTAASLNLGTQNYRDLNKWVQVPLATLYGHTPGATTPADGTYSPTANWRYGFSVGMRTATRTRTTYGSSAWLGIDALAADPGNITSGPTTEIISQPKLMPEGTYFYKAASALGNYTFSSATNNTEPPRNFLEDKWSTSTWYGKKTHYQTWVNEKKQETVSTHTFRADRPITIDFIGSSSGAVTLTSNSGGRILVAGPILNPSGTTTLTSSAGIVQTNENASVGGKRVVLTSTGGVIQNVRTNIDDAAGTGLFATAFGAISISEQSGTLPLEEVKSTSRQAVNISGKSGITRAAGSTATSTVFGGSITLSVSAGGVGASDGFLLINQGDQGTHVINVTATGSIFLEETAGNMHAQSIVSSTGDVEIKVNAGSLIDANRIETRDERTRDQLLATVWGSLNLTEGSGAQAKITETTATFAANKSRDYIAYWTWRNKTANPAVYDAATVISLTSEEEAAYRDVFTAQGQALGHSGQTLTNFVNSAIQTLVNSRSTQYHTLHGEFAAYDRGGFSAGDLTDAYVESFTYVLSTAEDTAIRGSIKIWTEDELLFTIGAGLLKEVTDTQTTIEADNISGRNIKLTVVGTAGSGNVGAFSAPVTLDVRPRPLVLTNDERILLASAERSDVIFISGTKFSGTVTFAANALTGDTLTRTNGTSWASDGFAAGKYIRVEGTTGNLTAARAYWKIDSVSGSVLTLERKGQTIAETNRSVVVTPVVLDPLASGVTVSFIEIAQRDDIDITSTGTLEASASGVLFVGSEGSLTLKSITSGGDAAIKSGGAIISGAANTTTVVITTDDLILEAASGGIGSTLLPLLMNLNANATLTARANNDVVLTESSGSMRLETIYSQQGNVVLKTLAGSILDQLANDLTDVKAANISLTATGGDIGAAGNLLDIDQGPSGSLYALGNNVYVWETFGEMRVDTVNAVTGDVLLKAHQSILDIDPAIDPGLPAGQNPELASADVTGNNVTLTSLVGGIGNANAELEIDSRKNGTGTLTLSTLLSNLYVNEFAGDLYLNTVGTGSTATAFISSLAGKIVDGRTNLSLFNIESGRVYLFAAQDIGSSENPITTKISNVEGKSTSGSTYIENTGHLTVGGVVPGADPGMIAGGQIRFVTNSPVTIAEAVTAAGDITVEASEEVAAGDDLTITGAGSLTSTGGSIYLRAGDNINLQSGSRVTAPGLLEIRSALNDLDMVTGTSLLLNGQLKAKLITIHGSEFIDTITLGATGTVDGVTVVEGRGGSDTITNSATNTNQDLMIIFGDSATFTYDAITLLLSSAATANAGTGSADVLTNSTTNALLVGGTGTDNITGGAAADWVVAGEATITIVNNKITAITVSGTDNGVSETINAGNGNNVVIGGTGADTITAGTGTNTILGDEGQVTFDSSGSLTLAESTNSTAGAADTFNLGSGTYRVIAGAGNETITLGAGTNYVI